MMLLLASALKELMTLSANHQRNSKQNKRLLEVKGELLVISKTLDEASSKPSVAG